MNNQKPIFLFAFANDQKRPLRLMEEERAIRNILASAHDQGRIEVMQLGHTTLEDIYSIFDRFHNRIALFHYAGHSDSQFLNLEDRDARSACLSNLIGQQKHLQLVFLNGCANNEQVEHLLAQKIPAVIATNASIEDQSALDFSRHFYQAFANGKTISDAFEAAKSFVQNDHINMTIGQYRSMVLPMETDWSGGFPWGLYHQNGAVLQWSLPVANSAPKDYDFFKEVPIDLSGINLQLVQNTFSGMASFDHYFNNLFQVYQMKPSDSFNKMQNDILNNFPSILSISIRELFTPEGKTQGRLRLKKISEAYNTLAQLLCCIGLANLWDSITERAATNPVLIRPEHQRYLEKYFEASPRSGSTKDFFRILQAILTIFKDNGMEPYVIELMDLGESLRTADTFYDAQKFLKQNVELRIKAGNIPSREVEVLCQQAEYYFSLLLQKCAFFVNYELITVKVISVDLPRKEIEPTFVHQKAVLKGRDLVTIEDRPIRRKHTCNNNSVFITRDLEKEGLPLNLSPFLIDQNAFKKEKHSLPKVYFFDGLEGDKMAFKHAESSNSQNDFVVTKWEKDLLHCNMEMLFDTIENFLEDLHLLQSTYAIV